MPKWKSSLDGEVRQMSFSRNSQSNGYVLVTMHDCDEYYCSLLDRQGKLLQEMENIRTAVFNSDGETIIAGNELSLLIIDPKDFATLNEFQLSLPDVDPDKISCDRYRTFWLNEPSDKGVSMFVAFFEDEEVFNQNLGSCLFVHINKPLTAETSMQDLLASKSVHACYWQVN